MFDSKQVGKTITLQRLIVRSAFIALCCVSPLWVDAQSEVSELPVHFSRYFNNPQINPAAGGSYAGTEFFVGTRRNSGNFGGIATSFFSATVRLNSKGPGFNVLGAYFNDDREGGFLRRDRAYASYARHQRIGDNLRLAAGLSMGIYNFSVRSNVLTGAASGLGFDGNAGVWLYNARNRVGLSLNQFSNTKVQPLNQAIRLTRHYYLTAERDQAIAGGFKIIPSLFLRYTEKKVYGLDSWYYGVALRGVVKDIVEVGVSYERNNGIHLLLGIQNIQLIFQKNSENPTNKFNLYFASFLANVNATGTRVQTSELILSWYINGKGKGNSNTDCAF